MSDATIWFRAGGGSPTRSSGVWPDDPASGRSSRPPPIWLWEPAGISGINTGSTEFGFRVICRSGGSQRGSCKRSSGEPREHVFSRVGGRFRPSSGENWPKSAVTLLGTTTTPAVGGLWSTRLAGRREWRDRNCPVPGFATRMANRTSGMKSDKATLAIWVIGP